MGKMILSSIAGGASAVFSYAALQRLLDYTNAKAAVFQQYLMNKSELTEKVYEAARELTKKAAYGDLKEGLVLAGLAGLAGGVLIYEACRKTNKKTS